MSVVSMPRFAIHAVLLAIATFAPCGSQAVSDDYSTQKDDFLHYVDALARYSPMEGAQTHGSIGASMGLAVQQLAEVPVNSMQRHHLYMENDREGISVGKFIFVKGLSIPVDLGITLGAAQSDQVSMMGGHAQWTVFEGFRLPAFALRGSVNRIFGLYKAEATAAQIDLLSSYSFLSFASVYIVASNQRNSANYQISEYPTFGLQPIESSEDVQMVWTSRSIGAGARLLIMPPLVATSAEFNIANSGSKSFAIKASVEI